MNFLCRCRYTFIPSKDAIKTYHLGSIPNKCTAYLSCPFALMVALQLLVKKTKMGKAMRAVSVDSDAAELMGINVNNTISFTFALDHH